MPPRPPKPRSVLVKTVVQAVTATMVGDRVVGEQEGPRVACYSTDDLAAFWEKAAAEVDAANAEQNRAARRKS